MHILWASFGAFIFCYFTSRVGLKVVPRFDNRLLWLITVHVGSWALLALVAGFTKAYFLPFSWQAPLTYIAPQLFWLIIDFLRGKAELKRGI